MKREMSAEKTNSYSGKVARLGIHIAIIFIVPILIAVAINALFDIRFIYLLPFAFFISWFFVILLYRKVSREVKKLEQEVKKIQEKQESILHDTSSTSQ